MSPGGFAAAEPDWVAAVGTPELEACDAVPEQAARMTVAARAPAMVRVLRALMMSPDLGEQRRWQRYESDG